MLWLIVLNWTLFIRIHFTKIKIDQKFNFISNSLLYSIFIVQFHKLDLIILLINLENSVLLFSQSNYYHLKYQSIPPYSSSNLLFSYFCLLHQYFNIYSISFIISSINLSLILHILSHLFYQHLNLFLFQSSDLTIFIYSIFKLYLFHPFRKHLIKYFIFFYLITFLYDILFIKYLLNPFIL